jgi:hypothetical protein
MPGRVRVFHDDKEGLIGVEIIDLDGVAGPTSFWLTPFEAMSVGMSLTNAATAMRCRVPLTHRLAARLGQLRYRAERGGQ